MLARQFRLPPSTRFVHYTFVNTMYFTLRYRVNNQQVNRFGFVVGKKIDKRAVVRNRIKRVVRSCIEDEWVKKSKGYDMLFLLKKSCIDASRSDICSVVSDIMGKLKPLT